jgi:large subunit ribosomal protein L21
MSFLADGRKFTKQYLSGLMSRHCNTDGYGAGVQIMFAVFASGGKQHRVTEGEVIKLELLTAEPGEEVVFEKVLIVADGDDVNVGKPYVEGGKVTAEVISHDRGKKIHVLKFKRRKDYLRRQGHRQSYTELKITGISV